ncbi:MAG: lipoprotein NlpI [Syntrophorhabdus sp. PtaU1.Bin153]|nr:MAG: lipoprotein NlpI [Syntrophorhabdus sp. PtaU1.Bin153]
MRKAAIWALVLASLVLTSCAGLGIPDEAQTAFDTGRGLFNRGEYRAAVEYFESAISVEPDFVEAYVYLGRSYLNVREYSKALPALRTAYNLSPDTVKKEVFNLLIDALLGAATTELKKGNISGSIDRLRETLSLSPDSKQAKDELSRALTALGKDFLSKGDVDDAINAYGEALALSPDNAGACLGLARAFLDDGDVAKALATVQKTFKIDPNSKEALEMLRDVLVK